MTRPKSHGQRKVSDVQGPHPAPTSYLFPGLLLGDGDGVAARRLACLTQPMSDSGVLKTGSKRATLLVLHLTLIPVLDVLGEEAREVAAAVKVPGSASGKI